MTSNTKKAFWLGLVVLVFVVALVLASVAPYMPYSRFARNTVPATGDEPVAGGPQSALPGGGEAANGNDLPDPQGDANQPFDPVAPVNDPPHKVLDVSWEQLIINAPVDQAYCYQTYDGSHWSRWPADGFFKPATDGSLDLSGYEQAGFISPGDGGGASLIWAVDCWGWQTGELLYLGRYEDSLAVEGAREIATDSGLFSGLVKLNFSIADEFTLMGNEYMVDESMPIVIADVTEDPEDCFYNIPPEFQNLGGKLLFCWPYPGFDTQGANPQQYLIWQPERRCPLGDSNPPCLFYSDWLAIADVVGYRVVVYVDGYLNTHIQIAEAPYLTNYVIEPRYCENSLGFRVQMWAEVDGELHLGPLSDLVTADCRKPFGGATTVYITYKTLRVADIDDGDLEEQQDVEVFGTFTASTPLDQVAMGFGSEEDCEEAEGADIQLLYIGGFFYLKAQKPGGMGCPTLLDGDKDISRTVHIQVPDGHGISFSVSLTDYDHASGNDSVCDYTAQTPGKDYQGWVEVKNESFWFGGGEEFENGDCQVQVLLSGSPP